jgi:TetR/AcrR family transcriptional regulator, repressor of fatR-cypB operon
MSELSTQETLTRKEREKRARQQDILKAARELFVTRGYRETKLDEIALLAEFGKGTLYNYFASKEEIFYAIVDQSIDEALAIVRESADAPGGVREKLALYAQKTIRYIRDNGELLHVIYHELHGASTPESSAKLRDIIRRASGMWETLGAVLQKGIDEGTVCKCDPMDSVILLDGMVRGYCMKKFTLDGSTIDEDYAKAADVIVSVFLDGITERTSKG